MDFEKIPDSLSEEETPDETAEERRKREVEEDAQDLIDMNASFDLKAKVSRTKGDIEEAEKWEKRTKKFSVDDLSDEAKEDYRDALKSIELLKQMKGENQEKEMPNYCTQCGHKLEPGSKFCTNCGNKIQ